MMKNVGRGEEVVILLFRKRLVGGSYWLSWDAKDKEERWEGHLRQMKIVCDSRTRTPA
jgi:hypothetical protein